jgi:hypothetical protein
MLVYPTGIPTGGTGYTIENSLWFDGSADYLTKTFSGTGSSQTVYTVSFWAKPSTISPTGGNNWVIDVGPSSGNSEGVRYVGGGSGALYVQATDGTEALNTGDAAKFRDLTAWQHVVWSRNTGNSNGDKSKLYVNGTRITAFDSSYGTRGQDLTSNGNFGSTHPYSIGRDAYGGSVYYNGYLAEFAVIDGTEYAASDFGELDDNGVWVPVNPSGLTYGDNGFLLQFKQTGSGQDENGIGADTSGKGNHFAVGGGSIQTNQVIDSPTDDASSNIGNYATINPHNMHGGAVPVISNGNTTFTRNGGGSDNQQAYATQVAVGKKYFEFDITGNSNSIEVGWAAQDVQDGNQGQGPTYYGDEVYLFQMNAAGGSAPWPLAMIEGEKGSAASTNTSLDSGEITTTPRLKFAIDTDAKKYWLGVVHGSYGGWCNTSGVGGQTFDESAPTGTWTSDKKFLPYVFAHAQTGAGTFYFRDADWTDSAPSGFTALNTAHLPAPVVTKPSDYFKAVLYEGNGSDKSVTGVGFQPDFVWLKCRDVETNWNVVDVVRGDDAMLRMASSTNTEQTGANQEFETFDADGFTVTHHGGVVEELNRNNESYVAYCMKAGGSPSTLAVDSISSGVPSVASSVSTADHGGFSIGTFTATSGAFTVAHGLTRDIGMLWIKDRSSSGGYWVWSDQLGATTNYLNMNTNLDTYTDGGTNVWNGVHPGASSPSTGVFSTTGTWLTNGNSHVFYAFARTPGLIAMGTYIGNGVADGTSVVVDDDGAGFKPAFLLIKEYDGSNNGSWFIRDNARNKYNPTNLDLYAHSIDDDYTDTNSDIDFTANGFKIRSTAGGYNQADKKNLYLAFAETPFGGDTVAQGRAR